MNKNRATIEFSMDGNINFLSIIFIAEMINNVKIISDIIILSNKNIFSLRAGIVFNNIYDIDIIKPSILINIIIAII